MTGLCPAGEALKRISCHYCLTLCPAFSFHYLFQNLKHGQYSIKSVPDRYRQRGQISPCQKTVREGRNNGSRQDVYFAGPALCLQCPGPAYQRGTAQLHHQKHHQAYVTGANAVLARLDKARKENADLDFKATLKELSFHVGGFKLHNLFWENMAPAGNGGGGQPKGELLKIINGEFGKFERFKKEFTMAATSVEGSGWAALTFCRKTRRPLIMQPGKTQRESYPRV